MQELELLIGNNVRVMNKNILSAIRVQNEAEAFSLVEPLDFTYYHGMMMLRPLLSPQKLHPQSTPRNVKDVLQLCSSIANNAFDQGLNLDRRINDSISSIEKG